MHKQLNTPVLLVGFNRPDLFERVLTKVLLVKPRKIYIALDGVRKKHADDKVNIKKIINIVKNIKGFDVKTQYQKTNLGCKYGPVAAMNWFFKNEEMGIILEDDVEASEDFFFFCQDLLVKYKNDNRVGSISGNNFQFGIKHGKSDYYFSRYSHTCGWATWRRVWNDYDIEMRDYNKLKNMVLNRVFDKWIDRLYWKLIFNGIVTNNNDSAWDYQWNWLMWKESKLGIIPNLNLVSGIGFGRADATHTKSKSKFENLKTHKLKWPLRHPQKVERSVMADSFTQNQNYVLWKEVVMNLLRRWRQ